MMEEKVLITIIVPIYNAGKFLKERLDSFLLQTDQRFTVLLIDDGSTDNSGDIAQEYVKKYPNKFSYIYQENGGPGAARNTGIKNVHTKYLIFSDADDFNANKTIENVYKTIEESEEENDFIIFNPVIYNMTTKSYETWYDAGFLKEIIGEEKHFNPQKHPLLLETEANICRFVWNVDYLKRINFKFLEHTKWEDVPAHFYLVNHATKATFMEYEGAFFYRTSSGSQITAGNGKTRLDMQYIFPEILKYIKDKSWSKDAKVHMLGYLSNFLYWSLNVIEDEYRKEFVKICHNFYKKVSLFLFMRFFFKSKVCLRNKIMSWYLKSSLLYKTVMDRNKINRLMKIFNYVKGKLKK